MCRFILTCYVRSGWEHNHACHWFACHQRDIRQGKEVHFHSWAHSTILPVLAEDKTGSVRASRLNTTRVDWMFLIFSMAMFTWVWIHIQVLPFQMWVLCVVHRWPFLVHPGVFFLLNLQLSTILRLPSICIVVRIYRPDETIIDLLSGVQPSDTAAGDYMLSPEVDQWFRALVHSVDQCSTYWCDASIA